MLNYKMDSVLPAQLPPPHLWNVYPEAPQSVANFSLPRLSERRSARHEEGAKQGEGDTKNAKKSDNPANTQWAFKRKSADRPRRKTKSVSSVGNQKRTSGIYGSTKRVRHPPGLIEFSRDVASSAPMETFIFSTVSPKRLKYHFGMIAVFFGRVKWIV